MTDEQMIAVTRRVIEEGFGEGRLNVLDEVLAPGFVEHQAGISPATVEGVKRAISALHAAFPDMKLKAEEIVTSGDKAWARSTGRGTHGGPFMGMPPTGRPFTVTVMDVCRFENGKMVEHWGVADQLALLVQIGALPKPPQDRP
jgi:predicted ester cyclase